MAAFNFPDPTIQQTVTNPITGSTYQWKEPPGKWVVTTKVRAVEDIIYEGDNPPLPRGEYKLWYSTDTLELYFWYEDQNGVGAWVPTSVPIQVLEDLNAFAAQAEVDIDQLQYKQTLLQNAVDQIYLEMQTGSNRAPIFSDTEPTKHPDFTPPNDELITGDIWYDNTDPESLDQYIYDGTQWVIYGEKFVEKAGDVMTGDLKFETGDIIFQPIVPDGDADGARPERWNTIVSKRVRDANGDVIPGPDSFGIRVDLTEGRTGYNKFEFYSTVDGGPNARYADFGGGNTPAFRFFRGNFQMEGNRIQKLGNAETDTDALPYGQFISELQDFRDDLIQNLTFGTWRYNSQSTLPPTGRFFARNDAGANSGISPQSVTQITFHEDDLTGATGAWDRIDVGELLTMSSSNGLQVKYKVNSIATVSGPNSEIRTVEVVYISKTGTFNFVDTIDWSFVLTEFEDISVDELDDTYLRLDASNGPVTDHLDINKTPESNDYGEGTLNLIGRRTSAGVTCGKITFNNLADEDNPGIISYNTLNENGKFTFNQDIKLDSGDADNQANLNFASGGQIQQGGGPRITFKAASNGNQGSGLVEFSRPGNAARRGVAIRGNIVDPDDNTQMKEVDLLYTYTNNSGTSDAVNYEGKSDSGNNIVNYKTMQKYIKDLGVNLDNYSQMQYEPLKEDLEIVEGAWTGSAGDGNLKVESLEDVSTHVGWMPNNTGKIFEGQPIKFVHDSGVRYGRVEAVWTNSNTTHLTVGDWAGDPFVAGEKTTVEYQLAPFVKKEGDTMSGNLTIKKTENGPASGGTQGQEAKLILNGDRNGTSNAVATVEFRSESSVGSKTGYLAYYSGDADAGKTIFTLNKPLESGGLYVNANNKGKTDGPGSHEYSFVVNSSGYSAFFVQGNNAYVRNDIFIGAYSENDNFSGAKKVATEEVAAKYRTRLDLGAYKYRRSTDSWGSGGIQSNTTTNTGDMFEFKIHHTNVNSIAHTKQLLDQSVGGKMYIGLYRTNDNYYQGRITSVDRSDGKGVIVTCTLVKQKGTFTLDSTIWVTLSYNPQEMYVHTLS